MGTQSRRDYLRAIKVRYKHAPKKEKKEILDEFCKAVSCKVKQFLAQTRPIQWELNMKKVA